jgi:hypothetical protein
MFICSIHLQRNEDIQWGIMIDCSMKFECYERMKDNGVNSFPFAPSHPL